MDLRQKKDRFIAKIFTRYPGLTESWAKGFDALQFEDSPWTPFRRDPGTCRLALITTGGVHLKSQPSFDMEDPAGDPSFREIPADASPADLAITQNYYDPTDAEKDINILFPVERIGDLKRQGLIGDAGPVHYSFMGHLYPPHIETLLERTAPAVARALKAANVEMVILTPA